MNICELFSPTESLHLKLRVESDELFFFFFTRKQTELVNRFKTSEAGGKLNERNATYPYAE